MAQVLVRLRDRYTASRMTLWRMRREPGFPEAEVVIRNTEYYDEDKLQQWEQSLPKRATRSIKRAEDAISAAESESGAPAASRTGAVAIPNITTKTSFNSGSSHRRAKRSKRAPAALAESEFPSG